jgi:mRNA interferase MazF
MTIPRRGEVWLLDLEPTRSHAQGGFRPALVVSDDLFNQGPADLCIVVPITSRLRPIPSRIRISPPEGGLDRESAALCEAVRSVSKGRLTKRLGTIRPQSMRRVEDVLRILMRL